MNMFLIFCLSLLVFFSQPAYLQALDFQKCQRCHGEDLIKDQSRYFLHAPFAEQKCDACHAAPEPEPGKDNAQKSDIQKKIKWLRDCSIAYTNHAFRLPGNTLRDTLIVELYGKDHRISRYEISVPSLESLVEIPGTVKAPTISDIEILKVERGAFLSATIRWKTDTLTNAQVGYGFDNISQTTTAGKRYAREHQVVLHNLVPDKTYHFNVISHDLFGRGQISKDVSFSTSDPETAGEPENRQNMLPGEEQIQLSSYFHRLGPDYLLELELQQPASVFIGSKGALLYKPEKPETPDTATDDEDNVHAGLSSAAVISLQACLNCHKKHSHPLNVPPKMGMIIPPEYPVLPDGRISCASCHAPHGSDHTKLTRKDFQYDLCVGCHIEFKKYRR